MCNISYEQYLGSTYETWEGILDTVSTFQLPDSLTCCYLYIYI